MRLFRVVLAAVLVALICTSPAHGAAVRPPDLGMARLSSINLTRLSDGRTVLRFSATVVNVGTGPFELHATRPDSGSSFSVVQRLFDDAGGSSDRATPVQLVFAGDGHSHWHVRDLQRYELVRIDNGSKVGTSMKGGFCFFDTTAYRLSLPGAPQQRVYNGAGCGTSATGLTVDMGLSVGWGDTYPWNLPDQFIDVTGLSAGRYRLIATADPLGQFHEGSEANNVTWVDIQLKGRGPNSVRIDGYGPSA